MLFQYRAIGTDGKEIKGSIEAPSLEAAKDALEDTHVEVVDIHEAKRAGKAEETPAPLPISTFAFEGTDASGAIRRGTIQAENKHEAFDKLRVQGLFLKFLSPLGAIPQYKDYDLERWQGAEAPATEAPVQVQTAPAPARRSIGFVGTDTVPVTPKIQEEQYASATTQTYHPLMDTLRLYAGWLLAWYAVFVALGYYSHERMLPWNIPFVQAFFLSPLIFSFVVAIFLFLFLSSIHKRMRGGMLSGLAFAVLGVLLLLAVRYGLAY